ncbi:hypothetical protein [Desulfurococcus mucosus]|uniref:Uncharacterized protein n=1 Tax=Desulfurococcus mucosus (strain ATCC 35584 / DSM 2162 / JCM 9187 / O7/1) TaxID=765177 RepID=E8R7Z8_DESM0|nr:hypothetical protein [Desulfurococcus mucosus]ADV64624.1 hypothetical protein Desmu_0305 [Desulfurococcus mucosus DSM 2162]
MAVFKPGKNRREIIEELLRDLDPSLREEARRLLESMSPDELAGLRKEDVYRRLGKQRPS